ncbi:hypothetical protein JR316_0002755 [Psilocybe cubensis]|uniref:Uncharacterized protein n=2 Tax=Psilocybe cubensis TaxID=181762 RepID=A0ACB8HFB9_PSICU|nr:hypothetical protein JR316_0002755 [Psilocybe cubensis]KAH9485840.1 hypothetical protein JR316_0002755 [Psilocybe cubensis]
MKSFLLTPIQFVCGNIFHLAELVSEGLDIGGKARKWKRNFQKTQRVAAEKSKVAFFHVAIHLSGKRPTESPTPHLLWSNHVPNESEVRVIKDFIHHSEVEMEHYLEQLKVKKTWRKLTLFRYNETKKFMSEHKAIISPIRRLPPEMILQLIFIHAIEAEPERMAWHCMSSVPYGIAQVSSVWRKIALNTPDLWTRIPTIPIERLFTTKPQFLAFLSAIISRTGAAPLELSFYGPDYMASDGSHPAVNMLIEHSSRWKSLTIEISSLELSIFDAIKGRLPMLETLVIRGWYFISPISAFPIDIFHDSPRLREVSLFHVKSKMLNLPFHQLVRYEQEEGHPEQLNLLFNSSQLSTFKTLSLRAAYGFHVSLPSPFVTLTSLTTLMLRSQSSETHHWHLLDQLVLPVLEELLFDSERVPSSTKRYPSEPIFALITRGPRPRPLKKLYIRSLSTSNSGGLIALLRQLPFLTHLTTDMQHASDLQSIAHAGTQIIPNLRSCSFFADELLSEQCSELCRTLAANRCEKQHTEFVDNSSYSIPALHIHFPDDHIASDQQKILQQWSDTASSLKLRELRKSIIGCLPELTLYSRRKPSSRLRRQASFLLSSVREVNINNANEIYVSGIHKTLHRISTVFAGSSTSDSHLSDLAKLALEQWESKFNASHDDFRWLTLFPKSLTYISSFNDIRASTKAVEKIIFGELEGIIIPQSDTPWPSHRFS